MSRAVDGCGFKWDTLPRARAIGPSHTFHGPRSLCGQSCPPKRRSVALGDLAVRVKGLAVLAAVYLERSCALLLCRLSSVWRSHSNEGPCLNHILYYSLFFPTTHKHTHTHPRSIKEMTLMWGLGLHGGVVTIVSPYTELIPFHVSSIFVGHLGVECSWICFFPWSLSMSTWRVHI